jgi:hypothetical protein
MTNNCRIDINEALQIWCNGEGGPTCRIPPGPSSTPDGYRYHGVLQISPEFGRDLQRTAAGITFQAFMQFRRAPVNVIKADRSAARIIRSEAFQDGHPTVGDLPDNPLKPPLYAMDLLVNAKDVVQIAIVRFSDDSDEYTPEPLLFAESPHEGGSFGLTRIRPTICGHDGGDVTTGYES